MPSLCVSGKHPNESHQIPRAGCSPETGQQGRGASISLPSSSPQSTLRQSSSSSAQCTGGGCLGYSKASKANSSLSCSILYWTEYSRGKIKQGSQVWPLHLPIIHPSEGCFSGFFLPSNTHRHTHIPSFLIPLTPGYIPRLWSVTYKSSLLIMISVKTLSGTVEPKLLLPRLHAPSCFSGLLPKLMFSEVSNSHHLEPPPTPPPAAEPAG